MSDCLNPATKLIPATADDAWFGCRAEMPLNPEDWCVNCLVRAERERLKSVVLAFAENKMHAPWLKDLAALVEVTP